MATPFPFGSGNVLTAAQMNAITTLPVSTKTNSHTLTIADVGTRVIMNSASATTITVNTSIFGASDIVEILNIGAGVCTVTAGTCTVGTTGTLALVQNAGGTLTFISASASVFTASGVAATSKIAQVVSSILDTTFTTTSGTMVDSGLSVSITPTLNTSKILVMVQLNAASDASTNFFGNLVRGSTAIDIGATAGTRSTVTFFGESNFMEFMGATFLDSPATTSATTYKLQVRTQGAGNVYVNRRATDNDDVTRPRVASTITVMEVLA